MRAAQQPSKRDEKVLVRPRSTTALECGEAIAVSSSLGGRDLGFAMLGAALLGGWLAQLPLPGAPPLEEEAAAHSLPLSAVWLLPEEDRLGRAAVEATRVHVGSAAEIRAVVCVLAPPTSPQHDALGRVLAARAVLFLGAVEHGEAVLYLVDLDRPALFRRFVRFEGVDELPWAESIGLIAAAALRELEVGPPAGMTAVHPLRQPSAPPRIRQPSLAVRNTRGDAVAPAERGWQGFVSASVGYRGTYLAPSMPWASGADLALAVTLPRGFACLAGYGVFAPLRETQESVRLTLRRHPVRLGAGYRLSFPSGFHLRPTVSVELDAIRRSSRSDEPTLRVPSPATLIDIAIAPAVEGGVAAGRYVHLFVEVRLEVWVRRSRYEVDVTPRTVVFEPDRIRPTVVVGIGGALPRLPRTRTGA